MIQGAICLNEVSKASNNVLPEFCNFNKLHIWNKPSGGTNASVVSDVLGRRAYFGAGCIKIDFTGTGQVEFNSGGTEMQTTIQKTGNYILSYAFNKSDSNSAIVFIVEVFKNGILFGSYTITQDLYDSSGFINDQWNTYFQNLAFEYGDIVDFNFKVQSDTTACQLDLDRFKLEIDNKGGGNPTIYTEPALYVYEEENTITVGTILAGETALITASLTGAKLIESDKNKVTLIYPEELLTLGLVISAPTVTADNVVKFNIHNPTGVSKTPTVDSIYYFKLIR